MKRHSTLFAGLLCAQFLFLSGCHKNAADKEDGEPPEDNTPVIHSTISPRVAKGCGVVMSIHYGDAYKTLRQAEEFKARDRDWYVAELSDRRNEYLLAGISPKFRNDWLGGHKLNETLVKCMAPIFDEIGAAAKRTLPKYHPRGYTHHEHGEDGLIKDAVKEKLPDAKVLGVGVKSATWDIEKHGNGIPADRWKRGMAWVKSASFDDGYCRIVYVNIVQDYSGGGSFGDSKANYISMEPAGCP